MKESTRQNLVASDIWSRAFFMILFALAFSVTKLLVFLMAVYQFFSVLLTGKVNEPLLRFGKNLSIYIYEILEFQTFNSEIRPFPFTPWPDEEPGGGIWLTGFDEMQSDEDLADNTDDSVAANQSTSQGNPAKSGSDVDNNETDEVDSDSRMAEIHEIKTEESDKPRPDGSV